MNQEQPIGSDQQGLVSARRRSAARWELKSRVALTGTWNSDSLFRFAVQAILDHQACPSHLGEDRVWRRLLEMGLEGGETPGRAEGA